MKVETLIEQLKELPADKEVILMPVNGKDETYHISDVQYSGYIVIYFGQD